MTNAFSAQPARDAAAAQVAGLQQAYSQASDLLGQGRNAITTNYTAGLAPFLQQYSAAVPGQTAYGNAVGANGPQGYAEAVKNFQTQPGYQFALQQGTENVLRNQARTGQLASGGTNVDLQNLGQGMANQEYQKYVQNLLPFLGQAQGAAGGVLQGYSGQGNALAGLFGTQANAAYGTQAGIGNANANAALADYNASRNLWGAIGSGAQLGASAFGGGGFGLGSLGTAGSTMMGGGQSGVMPSGGSSMGGSLGLPSFGGGFSFSDERVKSDVEPVGELFDGSPLYRFRYKWEPEGALHIGLMAQDVEQTKPEAVAEFGGVKAVDYRTATNLAAELGRFL